MADIFTKKRRSEIMGRIKSKNTQPEICVRRLLHRLGFRFSLHGDKLPGKPDIVLAKWKTVVFVHGCFWHGHDCKRGSATQRPKSNLEYWNPKIDGNIERDGNHAKALAKLGWRRLVIWECQTANAVRLENKFRAFFIGRRTASGRTGSSKI